MKKLFLFAALAMLIMPGLRAQDNLFDKGDNLVNASVGLTIYSGVYLESGVPPVAISVERGIVDEVLDEGVIGVLGYLGYSSYKYDYLGWGWKYSNFIVAVGGTFHYPLVDKLDTYAGVLLGYKIVTANEFGVYTGYDYSTAGSSPVFSGFVGARYYVTDNFGVFGQVGVGIAYLNVGVTLKLGS